jgi:hypothetical protein
MTALYQTSLSLNDPHPGSTVPLERVEFTEVPNVLMQLLLTGIEIAPHGLSLTGGVIHEMVPENPEETPPAFESNRKLMHPPTVLWYVKLEGPEPPVFGIKINPEPVFT